MSANPNVMFGAVSHSPIIVVRSREPEVEPRLLAECAAFRARVAEFNPDFVVMFSNDHFASFHYANMPAFCIGTAAEAVDDVGGTPGKIPVPEAEAIALTAYLRENDFDPAISYKMRVDHGYSQPLKRLFGAIDRYPLIPIFTSVFTNPLISFRRSRLFGETVGRWAKATGKRVLFLGSGGLSHHPAHYFPLPQDAAPEVYGWQLDGEAGGTMTAEQWFGRLDDMHHEGADAIVAGTRTEAAMRLNSAWDQEFLSYIASGNLAPVDDWDRSWMLVNAGIGSFEIPNWISARAAYSAAGGGAVETHYDKVVDYAVGYALAESR